MFFLCETQKKSSGSVYHLMWIPLHLTLGMILLQVHLQQPCYNFCFPLAEKYCLDLERLNRNPEINDLIKLSLWHFFSTKVHNRWFKL